MESLKARSLFTKTLGLKTDCSVTGVAEKTPDYVGGVAMVHTQFDTFFRGTLANSTNAILGREQYAPFLFGEPVILFDILKLT